MSRKFFLLPFLLLFGLILASCSSNNSNPVTTAATGSVFVTSTPAGAQIWYDNGSGVINSNKVTPDTITNLSTGNHTFILKLTDYFNDTNIVNVAAGSQNLSKTLVSDKSISNYGPIQIWESVGTTASQPSGIILKTGRASSIASGGKDSVDIYYDGNAFVIATAFNINSRATSFLVGASATLTDGIASPLVTNTWVSQVTDAPGNYFFLYDTNGHYSKMIILSRVGGTPLNPSTVMVQWLYNNKANDPRF
jgi:hypothetical protein